MDMLPYLFFCLLESSLGHGVQRTLDRYGLYHIFHREK